MIGIFVNLWSRISGAGAYLLDQFGGAAAAYSLRRLSSSYGGPAIRVRRSLDNAEQDIGFQGKDLDQAALNSFVGYQNLFTSSQTAIGSVLNTTASNNVTTAPNGTNTAIGVLETANTDVHLYYNDLTGITIGASYTYSVYVKGNGRGIRVAGSTGFPSTVIVIDDNGNILSIQGDCSVISVGNGWYRVSLTQVATATTIRILVYSMIGTNTTFLGDVTKGIYLWGFQLNAGTTAQPYQVTTGTARSGDGFVTEWYTQDSAVYDNLLLQSQTFDDVYWTKNQASISANVTTDPFGSSNADKILEGAGTAQNPYVLRAITPVLGSTYNLSCYLKASERQYGFVNINANNGIDYAHLIDLSTGLSVANLNNPSYSVVNAGNGWWRLSLSITITNTTGGLSAVVGPKSTPAFGTYNTTLNSGIFIFGAQLSPTSWLQPYQQTVASATTRRDAIQTTAANQPQIVNGGNIVLENGKPAMLFDGVNDTFSVPSGLDVLQNVGFANSFAVVANNSSAAGYRTIYNISISSTASNSRAGLFVNGSVFETGGRRLDADTYQAVSGGTVDTAVKFLSSLLQYATSDAYLYSNNSLIASSTSFQSDGNTSNASSNIFSIGSVGTALFWSGDMQEITLYNTNQLPNRVNIESSINSYYKIY